MRIERLEARLTKALEAALAAGLLGILALIIVLVTMRYVFASGLVGANETATVVFVYLSSVGAAVAVGKREHIRVNLFPRMLGPRGQLMLDVASLGLVGLLNAIVAASSLTWIATTGHVPMPVTQIPRFAAQVSIPMGCSIATFYCCTRIVSRLRRGASK